MKSEDIELSSEECEEEPEAEPKGGETDPCLGFAFDFGPFFPFEESTPESGFFVVGSSLGGEKLGLWCCWWVLPLRGLWGFVEGRVEKLRALASKGGGVVWLLVGKDLSLRKRESRWEGRTELVKEEQLMAESCSRTHASCAWEIISSTAESSVSERSLNDNPTIFFCVCWERNWVRV